ncbi:MAG: hypothetical protein DSM106950_31470 [Stigonema ocellatum SAG 48.90 = DSM 106950]|nr:hypothetical protein [Stigonema ocellatum SAG 48.90 = DSM 106950]
MVTFGLNSASVLAQVNIGTNPASFLGIFLAVAGPALYFIRFIRPGLERDQDIFFAAIGLLCGFILIFQGWRLDPILQFSQLLLIGTTVFFAVESLRLRAIATEQAKRNTKIVDEREVSDRYKYSSGRRYNAEVDAELEPLPYDYEDEEERPRPRIQGSKEGRSSRGDNYYDDEPPRRSNRRNSGDKQTPPTDRTRRRSSGDSASRTSQRFESEDRGSSRTVDDWDSSNNEERRPPRRGSNGPTRPENGDQDIPPRQKRRRPPTDSASRPPREDDDVMPSEYVEYKPIQRSDEDHPDSTNFDQQY